MAVAFDVATGFGTGSGNRNISHIAASSGVKGALLLLINGVTTSTITATYGGTAMSEVSLSPLDYSAGEDGQVRGFFLGSSVPQGTQTCAISSSAGTYFGGVYTVTGSTDTEVYTTITDSGISANPSVTVATVSSRSTFVAGACYSGQNTAPTAMSAGANTSEVQEGDIGNDGGSVTRGTNILTQDNFTYGWTVASDDWAILAVAIAEVVAAAATKKLAALGVG